ncbi:unnamed protein product [Arctia plantaginis]|uniref:Uncharacterized protein n=1 Tax=Arctia plantaginis TaxID=874455 RepID=A0A8S0ZPX4_ARCPL|nr:unnamed protein product [Arctia plantaginis]
MKASMIILALTIIACAVISTDAACPKSKFFKGTCNALTQDCQFHCTKLERAKSGQCEIDINWLTPEVSTRFGFKL